MTWLDTERARSRVAAEENTVALGPGDRLRVCLCYPNTYFVGMSNLGFQTLYYLLNSLPGVRCERAFLPDDSARSAGPLVSLESQTPVGNFDVVAFSLSFDLDAVNVPRMLRWAGLPPLAAAREEGPLVIAGGILATFNPEPLAEIVDAFVIGEAEEIVAPLCEALTPQHTVSRAERLAALAELPGVYVPALYQVEYGAEGEIAAITPQGSAPPEVRRLFVRQLEAWPCHSRVLTQETEFGGLFLVETSRGCARGCKFCLAGHFYRPQRYRPAAQIIALARAGLRFRESIGLIGAAVSDHPEIERICRELRTAGAKVSLASLRADRVTPVLLETVVESGAQSIAFAPEAGTERLRQAIRKGLSEEQILAASRAAAGAGLKRLRLYFMVGLPGETAEDVAAISRLVKDVAAYGFAKVTVSAGGFIPKPRTAFEREAMAPRKVLRQRLEELRRELGATRRVEVSFESPNSSFLQGIISRGDRRLGKVLARLAAGPTAGFADWQRALAAEGLSGEWYANRERPEGEILPWERVGV